MLDFTCVRDTVYEDTETKNVYNCAQCSQIGIVTAKLGAEKSNYLNLQVKTAGLIRRIVKVMIFGFNISPLSSGIMDSYATIHYGITMYIISALHHKHCHPYLPAAAGIKAFYFTDPENHPLELIYFPENKGADKWHRSQGLFKGIDHTAIGISNTDLAKNCIQMYWDL